jgi:membrane protease subunit HflC
MSRTLIAALAALFVAALLIDGTLFTVQQTEQALITQLGQPVRVIEKPGLHAKLPLMQTVITFDRRLLDYAVPPEEVILGDQRRLIVDSFTRFRITDPLRYYQAVGAAEEGIRARLNSVVSSSLRRVLGNEQLLNVLSSERGRIMSLIRDQSNAEMRNFGVTVEDVRIRRADLPEENTQAVLARMQSERERVAKQARAEGAEASARIKADADRDRTVLLAEARATADQLRGEGEAKSINIYAAAVGRDPGFFRTWRTLQAYRDAFGNGASRLVMTPGDSFLKLLRQAPPLSPAGEAAAAPASASTPAPASAPDPVAPAPAAAATPEAGK